jgi:hypothetical protein
MLLKNIIKDLFFKLIYIFNTITIKMPAGFFMEPDKAFSFSFTER